MDTSGIGIGFGNCVAPQIFSSLFSQNTTVRRISQDSKSNDFLWSKKKDYCSSFSILEMKTVELARAVLLWTRNG